MTAIPPAANDLPSAVVSVMAWDFLGEAISEIGEAFLGGFEQSLRIEEL